MFEQSAVNEQKFILLLRQLNVRLLAQSELSVKYRQKDCSPNVGKGKRLGFSIMLDCESLRWLKDSKWIDFTCDDIVRSFTYCGWVYNRVVSMPFNEFHCKILASDTYKNDRFEFTTQVIYDGDVQLAGNYKLLP